MSDWFERVAYAVFALTMIACAGVLALLVATLIHTTEGVVVEKYYDDPDWVCTKTCVRQNECWAVVTNDVWYANTLCYSESEYDKIELGDYVKET